MATLNIKNFPDDLYERLQKRAEREHRSGFAFRETARRRCTRRGRR